jgi:hypothetical protein
VSILDQYLLLALESQASAIELEAVSAMVDLFLVTWPQFAVYGYSTTDALACDTFVLF